MDLLATLPLKLLRVQLNLLRTISKSLTENLLSKLSIVFSYFSLKKFKEKLDPRKFNGAIFLGLNGPVVKSHGSTDAIGFLSLNRFML